MNTDLKSERVLKSLNGDEASHGEISSLVLIQSNPGDQYITQTLGILLRYIVDL